MRFYRLENPDEVVKLFPWIVPAQGQNRMDILEDIYHLLRERPDDMFILVAIEREIARAVLIAHVGEVKKRSVWIYQAQAEPGFKESKMMFDALLAWAKSKQAKMIRAGVNGHERAIERRWGFRQYKDEMRLKL